MHQLLYEAAERDPDQVAFVWVERDRRLTYAEAVEGTERVAGFLHSLGIAPGERVTVFANNGLDYLLALTGCWRLGAIPALVTVRYADELEYYLDDHEPAAIVYTHEHLDTVQRVRATCPSVRHHICLDGAQPGAISWPDGLAAATAPPADPGDEDAIAHLSYTSGTSGRPKGACLSHEPTVRAARCIAERLRHRSPDVSYGPTALSSSYQLVANLLPALASGATACVTGRWSAQSAWRDLDAAGATVLVGNPVVLAELLDASRHQGGPPGALRLALSGGAPLGRDLKVAFRDKLHVPIAESYGQSELGGFVALGRPEPTPDDQIDAVGPPPPDKEVQVIDVDGRRLPPGQIGELVLRGGFMPGTGPGPSRPPNRFEADGCTPATSA